MKVTCGQCAHPAEISSASDAWKCNCIAQVGPDPDCLCDAINTTDGAELNPADTAPAEIQQLEARLLELKGGVTPSGEVDL